MKCCLWRTAFGEDVSTSDDDTLRATFIFIYYFETGLCVKARFLLSCSAPSPYILYFALIRLFGSISLLYFHTFQLYFPPTPWHLVIAHMETWAPPTLHFCLLKKLITLICLFLKVQPRSNFKNTFVLKRELENFGALGFINFPSSCEQQCNSWKTFCVLFRRT